MEAKKKLHVGNCRSKLSGAVATNLIVYHICISILHYIVVEIFQLLSSVLNASGLMA